MNRMMRLIGLAGIGVALSVCLGCGGDTKSAPSPITARLTVDPSSGTNMTLFNFTAEGIDSQGRPFQPRHTAWDWQNDGVLDTPFLDSPTMDHLYAVPGTYTARVQIRDAAGQLAEATLPIDAPQHDNPLAINIAVTPRTGTTQTVFTFGAGAFEFLGGITQTRDQLVPGGHLRWDWEDDGIFDTPFTLFDTNAPPSMPELHPVFEHQFTTPGVKQVRVQLMTGADRNHVGTKVTTVTVTSP